MASVLPLVVLIPVRDRADGLRITLASLAHDRDAFDIVAIDDGSRCDVSEWLSSGHVGGKRLTVLRQSEHKGIAAALNRGLAYCREQGHEFVARIDAGDRHVSGRFTAQMAFLSAHPDHVIVGGDAMAVTPSGALLWDMTLPRDDFEIRRHMRVNSPFIHPAIMVRASAFGEIGGYDESYRQAQDYEMYHRLLRVGKGANLAMTVLFYEHAPHSISVRQRRRMLLARLRTQWRYADGSVRAAYGMLRTLLLLVMPSALVERAQCRRGGGRRKILLRTCGSR